jgi:hypothetical protein
MKAKAVSRNPNVEQLRSRLAELKKQSGILKVIFEKGADQIREYCAELRTQVHLETEILIEQVHRFNENMIAQIDQYEEECISSLEYNSVFIDDEVIQLLDRIERFCIENSTHLTEFKLDDEKVETGLA